MNINNGCIDEVVSILFSDFKEQQYHTYDVIYGRISPYIDDVKCVEIISKSWESASRMFMASDSDINSRAMLRAWVIGSISYYEWKRKKNVSG
jgi:hypothetical protein